MTGQPPGVALGAVTQFSGMNTWETYLNRWDDYLVSAAAPQATRDQRRYHLERFIREIGVASPAEVTFDLLVQWFAGQKNWKPNTKRAYRGSLRAFYSWALAAGVVTTSVAHQLPPVKVPRAKPRPTPDPVYRQGLQDAPARIRRAIQLGGHCGLRRGEIARVRTYDVELVGDQFALRVIGKGGHVRIVPLPIDLARELIALEPGWVFPSPSGGHLTPHHLAKLVKQWLDGYTTHTLRHRCGTHSYRASRDPRAVQELLGHAKLDTITVYTEVALDAVRAAMEGAA